MIPKLLESTSDWIIEINPDLKPSSTEAWKKGITRYWGFDSKTNTYKLRYVKYPKESFSQKDIIRIMPKYNRCPNCTIGKKLINTKNNNKNMALNIKLPQAKEFSIIDTLGKIPKIGTIITDNRMASEKVIMQLLATLTRYPIAILATDFGKRLASFLIGLAGVPLVNKFVKSNNMKSEWLEYFSNMMTSSIEMTGNDSNVFGVRRDAKRLVNNLKAGNFAGVSDALLKNQAEVKAQLKRIAPKMSMNSPSLNKFSAGLAQFGKDIQSFFENTFRVGRLRLTETTIPKDSIHLGSKGIRFNINEANDYRYVGTEDRFKDVSRFSKGFKSSRRLTESSDAVYR